MILVEKNESRRTLLNIDNEINLIKRDLCEKFELKSSNVTFKSIQIIHEKIILNHEIHFLNIEITNHVDHQRFFEEIFLIVNM